MAFCLNLYICPAGGCQRAAEAPTPAVLREKGGAKVNVQRRMEQCCRECRGNRVRQFLRGSTQLAGAEGQRKTVAGTQGLVQARLRPRIAVYSLSISCKGAAWCLTAWAALLCASVCAAASAPGRGWGGVRWGCGWGAPFSLGPALPLRARGGVGVKRGRGVGGLVLTRTLPCCCAPRPVLPLHMRWRGGGASLALVPHCASMGD